VKTQRSLLAACLLALLPLAAPGGEAPVDRLIVKWRNADSAAEAVSSVRVRSLATRTGQALTRGRNIGGNMSVLHLDRGLRGREVAATLAALRADPDVELAEPDRRVKIQAYTPSDPLFVDGLTHLGQFYERQWYLKSGQVSSIRADTAWDVSRGGVSPATSIVVAVLDTGVRLDHPDLAGKLVPGYDFVSDLLTANDGSTWDADPSDPGDYMTAEDLLSTKFKDGECGGGPDSDQPVNSTWHGTRVAGMIGASTDNAQGMAGAGFNVRVLPVRVLGKCGGFMSDVIAGMYWSAGLVPPPPVLDISALPPNPNPNPAQILNMSLGSEGSCAADNSATYRAAVRDISAHGVLIVASAGNEGAGVGTPASCTGVLAVAGLRHAGTKVGYSNLGPEVGISAPAGNCVFIAAGDPCVFALNTTTNLGAQGPESHIYSSPFVQPTFGTSFSAPLASATAGLMKAVNPALTPALLIARIRETARAFPATSDTVPAPPACVSPTVTPLQEAECICNTAVCGAGMLDAGAAVNAALRPAVLVQVIGTAGPGRTLTLDGASSAAATGRSIASYAWTVASLAGGATTPTIQSATLPRATVLSPAQGSITLRLTVTDNLGSSDSASVTITAAGGSTSTSPPPSIGNSGGGGALSVISLLLAALLLLAQRRRFAPAQD
jgi:serine protease